MARRALAALLLTLAVPAARAVASGPSAPAGAGAAAECALQVAERVQAHYDAIQDLQARFSQTTQSVTLGSAGGTALEAHGRVVFAKPGRMRWSYEAPEPSLVVTDGETLWIYDPEAREAQRMAVTGAFLSGAAIQFLLGEGDITREFEISSPDCVHARRAAPSGSVRVQLELQPRSAAHYERLFLSVDPSSGQVHETTVVDLFGNRTQVKLLDVEVDRRPDAATFRFDPPDDVRVIDVSGGHPATTQ